MRKFFLLFNFSLFLAACNFPAREISADEFSTALDEVILQENTATIAPTQPDNTATPALPTLTPLPPATQTKTPIIVTGDPLLHLEAGPVMITTIGMYTENEGWALGGLQDPGGHVLHTSDGGQSWYDVTPPEPVDTEGRDKIPSGYFLDENTAWISFGYTERFIVPIDPLIWFTQDGGISWQPIGQLPNSSLTGEDYRIQFIEFTDAQHGWVMVYLGAGMSHRYVALFATTDRGFTWELLIDPFTDTSMQLCQKTGLIFADAVTGWITMDCFGVMDGAQILQTTDGGTSWQSLNMPINELGPDFETSPFYCYTHSPIAVENETAGSKELHLALTCQSYQGDKQTFYNYILYTNDEGQNWASMPYEGGNLARVSASSSATEDILYILGTGIYSLPVSLDNTPSLVKKVVWQGQFSFINPERGWAVAHNGDDLALVYTTNSGETWGLLEPMIVP